MRGNKSPRIEDSYETRVLLNSPGTGSDDDSDGGGIDYDTAL